MAGGGIDRHGEFKPGHSSRQMTRVAAKACRGELEGGSLADGKERAGFPGHHSKRSPSVGCQVISPIGRNKVNRHSGNPKRKDRQKLRRRVRRACGRVANGDYRRSSGKKQAGDMPAAGKHGPCSPRPVFSRRVPYELWSLQGSARPPQCGNGGGKSCQFPPAVWPCGIRRVPPKLPCQTRRLNHAGGANPVTGAWITHGACLIDMAGSRSFVCDSTVA